MGITYLLFIVAGVGLGAWLIQRRNALRQPTTNRQDNAARQLADYALRLRSCADRIGAPHAEVFWDMAELTERIRAEVQDDARDLAQARRFIGHHARLIVQLIERFTVLEAKARPEQAERLEKMAQQVHGYRDVFARVERALIDNDFADIEATMAALDIQLQRLDP
jgi:hypothetical protein